MNKKVMNTVKITAAVAAVIIAVLAVNFSVSKAVKIEKKPPAVKTDIKSEIIKLAEDNITGEISRLISPDFLKFSENQYSEKIFPEIKKALLEKSFGDDEWYRITGETVKAAEYRFNLHKDENNPALKDNIREISTSGENTVIRMAGDTSLADNWKIMPQLDKRGKGVRGILSDSVIDLLKSADITILNNEFTFSERGTPLKNKMFTFRANPGRVSIFKELGIDLVSLANNHAFDYGEDAFFDTMKTLSDADIGYVGGGKDLSEAQKPYYFIAGGRKIAVTAASRAEKYRLTPDAGEKSPGVLAAYNVEDYLPAVKKAAESSDYNIVFIHWGNEGSMYFDKGIQQDARKLIDAGADIIVGAHAHVLQGMEFIKGKPVVYNLGNFIFNAETLDSGILEITLPRNGAPQYRFIPCLQKNCFTEQLHDEAALKLIRRIEKLSYNTVFSSTGVFTEKKGS